VELVPVARENLRREGIRACFFLQFGYPGETWADILKTVELVRQTRPEDIGVSVSYPLPGTKFYERVREELGEKRNWVDSDDLSVMFKGTYTNDFYRALRDALHAEVDLWAAQERGGNGNGRPETKETAESPAQVARLWETVEQMEKSCRHREPTLVS
jgi:radical SAM superfamily enzyme YgiQ (UPF0313 family)